MSTPEERKAPCNLEGGPGVHVSHVTTSQELNAFLRLPWHIYRGDRNWVPPLIDNQRPLLDRTSGHPFHRHADLALFLARSAGTVVGRIAAIENREYNKFHNDRTGFFGFFESIDDPAVAQSLIDTAAGWLNKRDLTPIQGPVNPSTNHEAGLLIEGFDTLPVFMMTYNPPYYPTLLEACGFTKAMDLNAYYVSRTNPEPPARFERVKHLVGRVHRRGDITIRKPDLKRFDKEAEAIKYIYHRAWSANWGFVPWTDAEFDHQAAELKQLIVPELTRIIEVDGRPAAFGIMLPDYNEAIRYINGRLWPFGLPLILAYYKLRRIKGLRLFALGVVEEHRKAGLEALLMHDLYLETLNSHYQHMELSWTLEVNTLVNNAIEAWGCKVYKRYRIYEKAL